MKKIFINILLVLSCSTAIAQRPARVPAIAEPITRIQPNGDSITIYLRGDEWHHYTLTLDGYLIAENKRGYYCYAKQDKNGNIVPTCRKAHNVDQRSASEVRFLKKMPKGAIQKINMEKK